MKTNLSVLNSSGDMKITWDHSKPEECEMARQQVSLLKTQGYTFFLVDGQPIDEVSSGQGTLLVRKITVEELVESAKESEKEIAKKRRGRPAKTPPTPDQNVIAVRPLRGG